MWIASTIGFYSAVQDPAGTGQMVVRARVRADLERLIPLLKLRGQVPIIHTPTRDYPYRVFVSRRAWRRAVDKLAENIDYGNFKSACPKERSAALHGAWSAFAKLERIDPTLPAGSQPYWRGEREQLALADGLVPDGSTLAAHGVSDPLVGDVLTDDERDDPAFVALADRPLWSLTDAEWRLVMGEGE